jgi:LemA protein
MSIGIIILIIVGVVLLWFIAVYNGLVKLRIHKDEAWADIDVQLKRRYDLIPNLVDTVKGYANHEEGVFTKVTEARTQAIGAQSIADQAEAENMLTGALKSLFAVAESYPELKANENFLELQRELSDTENKIQAARRFYNANVKALNIKIDTVPSNIVANIAGFKKSAFFELGDDEVAAREPVKVDFNK